MNIFSHRRITLAFLLSATIAVVSCAKQESAAQSSAKLAAQPKIPPYPMDNPPLVANLDSGKRSNVFYVGEPISFRVDKPATRYEVRDYRANIVDKGSSTRSSNATLKLKAQPPGWYKLYIYGATNQGDFYENTLGGTTFVVFRRTAGFPSLPSREVSGGSHPSQEAPMRGVTGMGPQRLIANADDVEGTIRNLEKDIALDRKYYLPFDKTRNRVLMAAFGNGTKNLANVRRIVAHFKNDIRYWEPRNEPNFGSGGRDFAVNEMKPFYETVKGVSPQLRVLGPGTVSINAEMLRWTDDFLRAGGGQYIDAFSFHAYGDINGDPFLGRKSLNNLMALLKKYKLQNIEKWQTEQGYFAAIYKIYQPAHQARWNMLQMMLFEQYGIPKEHHHLWYDRSHGFWGVPAWWQNDDGSLNPAAPLMRVWSEELLGTRFSKSLDFGAQGNNLYLGAEFRSPDAKKTVLALMSGGDTRGQVEFDVTGGKNLRVVSAWGVAQSLPVKNNRVLVAVGELPIYIEVASGQSVKAIPTNWGNNLARMAGVEVSSSAKSTEDNRKIVNGEWENWIQNGANQPWHLMNPTLPVSVDIKFPQVQSVSRVVIFSAAPWQQSGSLLDYELQYKASGAWKTIAREKEAARTFYVWTPPTKTVVDSFHSDRWIFQQQFAPVRTAQIRLIVRNATYGGGANEMIPAVQGGQALVHKVVMLREVQVFAK